METGFGTGTEGQEVLPYQNPSGLCLERSCGEEPALQKGRDGGSKSW